MEEVTFRDIPRKMYPVCPVCGEQAVVAFTGPKDSEMHRSTSDPERWDYRNAELYCAADSKGCNYSVRVRDLNTPMPSYGE